MRWDPVYIYMRSQIKTRQISHHTIWKIFGNEFGTCNPTHEQLSISLKKIVISKLSQHTPLYILLIYYKFITNKIISKNLAVTDKPNQKKLVHCRNHIFKGVHLSTCKWRAVKKLLQLIKHKNNSPKHKRIIYYIYSPLYFKYFLDHHWLWWSWGLFIHLLSAAAYLKVDPWYLLHF